MLLHSPLLTQQTSPRRARCRGRRMLQTCRAQEGCSSNCGGPQAAAARASESQPLTGPLTQQPSQMKDWPAKSDLYLLRSDGMSCTRETVEACGSLSFSCPSSQQHLLVWKQRPRCVMLLKKLGDELSSEFLEVLGFLGQEQGMRVLVEPHEYEKLASLQLPYLYTYAEADLPDLHTHVDFVACLGGDGLILHASILFKHAIPPIISFKLGSLGFLTCHDFKDYQRHLANLIEGYQELATCRLLSSVDGSPLQGVYVTLRMRLLCQIWRAGSNECNEEYEVLNEVVVSRGSHPFLTKLEVYEHDTLITTVQADGVMLATPTGSTAYNVAAGGSMVHPSVPAIMFTPICPHSLSFRPVILPDYSELTFRIAEDARSPAMVCLDGKIFTQLNIGDSVHVRMSPNPVPTINNSDQTIDWFNSIERCFHWNERLEQRSLHPSAAGAAFTLVASDDEGSGENGRSKSKQQQQQQSGGVPVAPPPPAKRPLTRPAAAAPSSS